MANVDPMLFDLGSPAHAGMVPSSCLRKGCFFGLPRTRGDGPSVRASRSGAWTAPPHTRGWSLEKLSNEAQAAGSPAHAGMVPCSGGADRRRGRLPRTRGDGPPSAVIVDSMSEAPPHTRGWSRTIAPATLRARGSPAHAGMVPQGFGHPSTGARLPRTRGDGPPSGPCPHGLPPAPPHTRGWSPKP